MIENKIRDRFVIMNSSTCVVHLFNNSQSTAYCSVCYQCNPM